MKPTWQISRRTISHHKEQPELTVPYTTISRWYMGIETERFNTSTAAIAEL